MKTSTFKYFGLALMAILMVSFTSILPAHIQPVFHRMSVC